MVHERVTTALDVLGLLLVAAGVCAVLVPLVGWAGLAAAGVVVLTGSWWAATRATAGRTAERGDGTG